jgi:Tfp pilus assembly PilM family ATPase
MIFDFELQGEIIEQGIPKLAVMVYTAPRQEIEDLKSIFARIGRPLTGISIVPFAVQNLFRTDWINAREETIACLFLGNDFSRIDLYAHGNLVMTRGIKAGNSSMIEALGEAYNDSIKGRGAPSLTFEQGRKILFSLSPDSPPLLETDAGFSLEKDEIFAMIQPALERLVRQGERTFEHFSSTQQHEKITRIFVSGAMSVYQPIADYVGAQLGIACNILDPLSENDAVPICPDMDDRHCVSERISFTPALGLALSDNDYTPNLIFTFKDKKREANIKRINRVIFASLFVVALIFTAVFVYQNLAIMGKKADIAKLEAQLAQLGPSVDRDQLMKMTAKVSERRKLSRVYADRYLGMVLISELAALTPANIRFLNVKINLGPAAIQGAAKPAPAAGTAATRVEEVTLEGLIFGDRQTFESALAGYAMLLEASPILRQVTIKKNTVGPYLKGEALNFILNMKVEEQVHG